LVQRRGFQSIGISTLALAALLLAGTAVARQGAAGPTKAERVEARLERQLERQLERALRQVPPVEGVPEPLACAERLAEIARYAPLPSRSGPDTCGSPDLVRLESVLISPRSRVVLEPAAVLRCGMAEAVARWVREDVAPAAAELGAPLAAIAAGTSYHCRSRNNAVGAKPSEHGRGNALDITVLKLRDGRSVGLADRLAPTPLRTRVRDAACERFTTVLGPGADAFHEDHIHVDLAERKSGYRICQWQMRDPQTADVPLPRPRPFVR
jgi:hypothetical protein